MGYTNIEELFNRLKVSSAADVKRMLTILEVNLDGLDLDSGRTYSYTDFLDILTRQVGRSQVASPNTVPVDSLISELNNSFNVNTANYLTKELVDNKKTKLVSVDNINNLPFI